MTKNVEGSPVDYALLIRDTEAVQMVRAKIEITLILSFFAYSLLLPLYFSSHSLSFSLPPILTLFPFFDHSLPPPSISLSLSLKTFYLLHEEGFFVGASSGLNVAAAVKVSSIRHRFLSL